ncbi:hypothetical protein D3C80_1634610 [compost metagenome]
MQRRAEQQGVAGEAVRGQQVGDAQRQQQRVALQQQPGGDEDARCRHPAQHAVEAAERQQEEVAGAEQGEAVQQRFDRQQQAAEGDGQQDRDIQGQQVIPAWHLARGIEEAAAEQQRADIG